MTCKYLYCYRIYMYICIYRARAWESHVSSKISLIEKCVFKISVLTIHIHIIQKVSKFYIYIYIYKGSPSNH